MRFQLLIKITSLEELKLYEDHEIVWHDRTPYAVVR